MSKLDVTNLHPWNRMEVRTVSTSQGNQEFVFIPNTWVRNTVLTDGPHTGKIAYMISDRPRGGYHIHPAFVTNGQVNDTGILVGNNIIGASKKYTEIKAAAAAYGTGFEPYNIYDHHFIARLMLIEYESADLQTLITTSLDATYHGFKHAWGGGVVPHFWVYGLDTVANGGGYHTINNTNIHILSNQMDGTFVNSGIVPCGYGWPITLLDNTGTNMDLGDVFLAKTTTNTENSGSLADYQKLTTSQAIYIYSNADGPVFSGPFSMNGDVTTASYSTVGFRLRKAV